MIKTKYSSSAVTLIVFIIIKIFFHLFILFEKYFSIEIYGIYLPIWFNLIIIVLDIIFLIGIINKNKWGLYLFFYFTIAEILLRVYLDFRVGFNGFVFLANTFYLIIVLYLVGEIYTRHRRKIETKFN